MRKHGVKKRQQRIDIVERRPAATTEKLETILLAGNQVIKDVEVNARGVAFDASDLVQRRCAEQQLNISGEHCGGGLDGGDAGALRIVAGAAQQNLA